MTGEVDKVYLSKEQRETAKEILERLSQGLIEEPEDILESWNSIEDMPNYRDFEAPEGGWDRKRGYVSVPKIVGTTKKSTNHLMEERLRDKLNLLMECEFKVVVDSPPKLTKFGERYYVAVDGNHRVIAFKALDLPRIYAEYIELPSP